MSDGHKILKEHIKKLPKGLRNYVLKESWANTLQNILSDYDLEEYQKISVENETLLVIVGLEPYTDLKENLEREAEIDSDTAGYITGEIGENILDNINIEERKEEYKKENQNTEFSPRSESGVGKSFEETILNQARAMMPAREDGQDRIMNYESRSMGESSGEYRDWETDRKSTRLNSSH